MRSDFDAVIDFPDEAGVVSGAWTLEVLPDRTASVIEVTPASEGDDFEPSALDVFFAYALPRETYLHLDASALDYQSRLSFTCSLDEPRLHCEDGPLTSAT